MKKLKSDTKTLMLWVLLPLAASILIHSLVLTPIYLTMLSDVAYYDTILPNLIGYLQLLLEYAFYWLLFVFLAKALRKWKVVSYLLPILFLLLFRQGLEMVMGYAVMGFPSAVEFFDGELPYLLLQLLFDCALLALAALIIHLVERPKRRAFALAFLPFAVQLASLAVMLSGYEPTKEVLTEAAIDLAVHIVCLFAGFCVICSLTRRLGKEIDA